MRLKKLGAALVVAAALGAVLASSALAAAVTEDVKWYTGASPGTELSGALGLSASQVGTGTLTTTVSGQEVVLHTTGTECVECKIENSGGVAVGSGKLKFTGVTVEKPANCTVAPTITTKPLSWKADYMIGSAAYWRFAPTAGEETAFLSFELSGASCPLSTTIIHKGVLFVQVTVSTGTQGPSVTVNSSFTINSTAGGTTHVGTEPASLTVTITFDANGAISIGTH